VPAGHILNQWYDVGADERAQVIEPASALQVGEEPGPVLVDRAVTQLPHRERECLAIAEVIRHGRVVAMPGGPDDGLVGRVFEPSMALSRLEQASHAVQSWVHRSPRVPAGVRDTESAERATRQSTDSTTDEPLGKVLDRREAGGRSGALGAVLKRQRCQLVVCLLRAIT